MKDQILKIAGVKTEKEFYKKYPTEEAFMKVHGKHLKKAAMGKSMVNKQLKQLTDFGNPPVAQVGAAVPPAPPKFEFKNNVKADGLGATAGAAGMGLLQNAGKIMGGLQAMGQQKKNIKNAEMSQTISGLGLEAAAGQRRNQPKNQYVRPEDNLVQPDQLGSAQGTGGNLLSMKHGGEIQNTYAPGTLYDNLEEIPRAEFGEYFQDSGQAQVGGAAGEALGSAFFGPAGGAVGKIVGQVAGNLLGGAKDARKLKAAQDATLMNQQQAAFQGVMQNQFGANMKQGGWVSHDWQPQVITKFGDHRMSELLKADPTMNTLRAGGHLKNYTPPSAEAMFTGREDIPHAQNGYGKWSKVNNDPSGRVQVPTGPIDRTPQDTYIKSYSESNDRTTTNNNGQDYKQNLISSIYSKNMTAGQPADESYMYRKDDGGKYSEFLRMAPEGGQARNELHRIEERRPFLNLIGKKQLMERRDTLDEGKAQGYLQEMNQSMPGGLPGMENGGYMAMGGNLQTHWGGDAEPMSYNPYIPGGGETVMFRGQSHDDTNGKGQSGIGITYGDNPVEVERGEPMTEMNGGGVVFGNMMMPGGKTKFKNYAADLSKTEAKQNKIMDKASKLALAADENDPFGRLSLNSSEASLIGANMKLKNIAQKKQDAADLQNAILDTADEMGLVADDLAKGKIAKAKFGGKFTAADGADLKAFLRSPLSERKQIAKDLGYTDYSGKNLAQQEKLYDLFKSKKASAAPSRMNTYDTTLPIGENIVANALGSNYNPYANEEFSLTNYPKLASQAAPTFAPIGGPGVPAFTNLTDDRGPNYNWAVTPEDFANESAKFTKKKGTRVGNALRTLNKGFEKYGETALSNLAPFLRPTDQEGLDPNQLMGEQYALAMNQLEPVQAQKFQPQLGGVMDLSYQDQLNEITAQSRAAERMMQNNPEAAANLFAQAAQAKSKVLAEQTRANMAGRKQVYDENRNLLNQAQLQNLQILDKQYERQSMAKSNTKAQAQAALNSISDKLAKNKLENRQLGIMENMYKYRFAPQGQAINYNDLVQFNMQGAGTKGSTGVTGLPDDYEVLYDINRNPKTVQKKKDEKRNGDIVRAIKLKNI